MITLPYLPGSAFRYNIDLEDSKRVADDLVVEHDWRRMLVSDAEGNLAVYSTLAKPPTRQRPDHLFGSVLTLRAWLHSFFTIAFPPPGMLCYFLYWLLQLVSASYHHIVASTSTTELDFPSISAAAPVHPRPPSAMALQREGRYCSDLLDRHLRLGARQDPRGGRDGYLRPTSDHPWVSFYLGVVRGVELVSGELCHSRCEWSSIDPQGYLLIIEST